MSNEQYTTEKRNIMNIDNDRNYNLFYKMSSDIASLVTQNQHMNEKLENLRLIADKFNDHVNDKKMHLCKEHNDNIKKLSESFEEWNDAAAARKNKTDGVIITFRTIWTILTIILIAGFSIIVNIKSLLSFFNGPVL